MFVEVCMYLVSLEEVLGRETDQLRGSLVPYLERSSLQSEDLCMHL